MSIASQLTALEGNIEDAYDMVQQRGGTMPARKNMENLDDAIATIPSATTYTAGTGIDITNNTISVDDSGLKAPTVSGAYCYYRKSGHFVWVSGNSANHALTANSYSTIFTLPSGYRPSVEIYCPLGLSSATKVGILRIKTTGEVQCWADSNTSYWNFSTTFAVA